MRARLDPWGIRVLMVLAVAGVLLGAVVPRVVAWANGRPLEVVSRAAGPGPATDEVLRGGATARWGDQVVYAIPAPGWGQRLADLAPSLLLLAVLATGVVLLWRLLDRALADDPFRDDALRTFRWLSGLIVVGALGVPGLGLLARMVALFPVQESPRVYAAATPDQLALALAGLAAAGLVEALGLVYRRGTELRADSEGLV